MHVERFIRVIEIDPKREIIAAGGIAVRTHHVAVGDEALVRKDVAVLIIEIEADQSRVPICRGVALRQNHPDA